MRPARPLRAATITAFLLTLTPVLAASPLSALLPPDTRAPTRPRHLRITSVGSYGASLAWNPSTDDSGSLSYVIVASSGYTMTVPQTSTTATWIGGGLYPRHDVTFSVYAVDPSGNQSNHSNTVRTTLPADTTVPGTPVVTLTDVGPHHASFTWIATDNDPYLSYFVYLNGVQVGHSTTGTSGTFYLPQADTAYTFTVRARDHNPNFSPMSAPLVFSTDPIDTTDTTPPTTPSGVDVFNYPSDRELVITWPQSTDNVDAPQAIRYEIWINGELAENVIGVGSTISYGEFGHNVIVLFAVDSAGNESGTVMTTVDI